MAGIFDKMVVGINKSVNSVSEGSKVLVEKAKLKTQMQEIEDEKIKLLTNMGSLVYNLQNEGQIHIEQCEGICAEIANLDQNISHCRSQLEFYDNMRNQPQQYGYQAQGNADPAYGHGIGCTCGYMNKEGARFCANCGKPLE